MKILFKGHDFKYETEATVKLLFRPDLPFIMTLQMLTVIL